MVERWTKLSDSQLKVGSLPAGLTCANLAVVEASDVQLRGKGQGFLDVALEQAESARKELLEQNRRLKGLLLTTVNGLQSVLYGVRTAGDADAAPEVRPSDSGNTNATLTAYQPEPISFNALFQNQPAEAAGETFNNLFASLRETLSRNAESRSMSCSCSSSKEPTPHSTQARTPPAKVQDSADIERLQAVIDKLRADLGTCHCLFLLHVIK